MSGSRAPEVVAEGVAVLPCPASDRGDLDLAIRLLEAGHEYVTTLAPDRERLVRELARYTRMLSAVAPLPPLKPSQYQLPELATLAGLGSLVHPFLVTALQRLRLRLGILRHGRPSSCVRCREAGGTGRASVPPTGSGSTRRERTGRRSTANR